MGPNTCPPPPAPRGAVHPHGHVGCGATEPWISTLHDGRAAGCAARLDAGRDTVKTRPWFEPE